MKHHLITLAFVVLAIVFYAAGTQSGFLALLACGMLAEGMVWMRLLRSRRKQPAHR